ncbi:MAG: cyclic nucleotide-binding/CBS domain-containing protein [Thermodesulfobacteriota bacterium]
MGLTATIGAAVKKDAPAVSLDDTLRAAIRKMTAAGCSALVVRSGAELVGVVTEMDLLDSIVRHDDLDGTRVSRFMTSCELITGKAACSPCVQLDENEPVQNALATMHKAGTHHLLVAGADNKAIGMISVADLLRLAIA